MSSARSTTRVLFVCNKNQVRSLTAQQVYRSRPDLEVRAAGLKDYVRVPLTSELMNWADLVFVFSKRQQRIIEARFSNRTDSKRVVCVNVPDRFEYKSPELISKLTAKLCPYLGSPANNECAPPSSRAAQGDTPPSASSRKPDAGSTLRIMFTSFSSPLSRANAPLAEGAA